MSPTLQQHDVRIDTGGVTLDGTLTTPADALGLVIFAHGSGSSRFSSRNRFVARQINEAGLSTLLMDLLTAAESAEDEHTREFRFDIDRLSSRLAGAVDWASDSSHIGLFGASTGAAAALVAAARRAERVSAVVSRGGRPDLAGPHLPNVQAPTLLIVGSRDVEVLGLNRQAAAQLRAEHRIEIVPGATHLFEESGTLEQVARLAADWFARYLR